MWSPPPHGKGGGNGGGRIGGPTCVSRSTAVGRYDPGSTLSVPPGSNSIEMTGAPAISSLPKMYTVCG